MSDDGSESLRYVDSVCAQARRAARTLSTMDDALRRKALHAGADRLRAALPDIERANARDLAAARAAGMNAALIDRLTLDPARIEAMAAGVDTVARLPDPLAEPIAAWRTERGLDISQVRIPLGVVAVIYESRPNVTADVAALCVKSANACILKGGKEAIHSNKAIADALGDAFLQAGLPAAAVQLVQRTDRETTNALLGARRRDRRDRPAGRSRPRACGG